MSILDEIKKTNAEIREEMAKTEIVYLEMMEALETLEEWLKTLKSDKPIQPPLIDLEIGSEE